MYTEYERGDGRGLSAYHPLLLTRLLLYGYSIGITSSRAIEKATYDSVAFRYLAADQHPDHDTIAHFRQKHLEALAGLFVQALRLCHQSGTGEARTSRSGWHKILANASTHRSVTDAQLKEREQYWKTVIAQLLGEAEKTRSLVADRAAIRCPRSQLMGRTVWRAFGRPGPRWRRKHSRGWKPSRRARLGASLADHARTKKTRRVRALPRSGTRKRNIAAGPGGSESKTDSSGGMIIG